MKKEDLVRHRIRKLREAARMSRIDIAAKLGIDQRNYAKIERGERKQLDLGLLIAIAGALGTDLSSLLEPALEERKIPEVSAPFQKINPVAHSAENHYEYVIRLLMEIIEDQRLIIDEKSRFMKNIKTPAPDLSSE